MNIFAGIVSIFGVGAPQQPPIVLGHWLCGAPSAATSMIGFIALAGIIVRNSILLVDFIRHGQGHKPLRDVPC